MSRPSAVLCCAVALAAAARAPELEAQERPAAGQRTRLELVRFAELLDSAAGQVSRPSPMQLMGPSAVASGYLLPGFGAIFVLPARALPSEEGVILVGEGPVVSLLRRDGRRAPKAVAREGVEIPGPPELKEFDRDFQQMVHVLEAYSREAELSRREAEESLERVAQEIRERFPQAVPPPVPGTPPSTPLPAAAPVAAPAAPSAGAPAPAAPRALAVPPAPPWRFWFPAEAMGDPRPPEQVVSEVKLALIQALEARGGTLTSVRPEDFLIVAVDFTARGFPLRPERRAERTLVLKARKRDLDERRAGKLAADELRKRIEAHEY